MLKIENVVLPSNEQWEALIRGMRNPKNSWDRTDSRACIPNCDACSNFSICQSAMDMPYFKKFWEGDGIDTDFCVGPNDFNLMKGLAKGGPVHAKYRRMIPVYLDITAPLYWWKEFDTYKVGTVANSCSTMHKIQAKEFTLEDFSYEHLNMVSFDYLMDTIRHLNICRNDFIETKDKIHWWQMIQLLPTSYNQKRTVMLSYEVLTNIYPMRKDHKLDEWHTFCDWIESLPYSELITGKE